MNKINNDRSLNGKERENERINVKKLGIEVKFLDNSLEKSVIDIEKLKIESEVMVKRKAEIVERIEMGKKLINGVKICDVLPKPEVESKPVEVIDESKVKAEEPLEEKE